ncbi:capsid protein [Chicken smacovirus mg5_1081]|uniref:Capsid protein n=1 Tax=Chicken smacovirus mg5_1081 TaxID=2720961 RepID=A0A6G9W1Y7_9VIRU|nr:capsid protein [Chicken smacovirus mg5_1081]QIR82268.1 capsid protein [Chicken smacovirus mg5_1081]
MVNCSISEIYDLSTSVGQGTVLKVHTPTGNNVKRHLLGFFLQYKKFKYIGADVTLVPASTLPADPLQLGYEEGEPTIDPRDMVNPILYKWYHGEAMLTDSLQREFPIPYGMDVTPVGGMAGGAVGQTGTSVDKQSYWNGTYDSQSDNVYPMCLMDPSFKKAGVQSGFRTSVKPFVYNLVTNEQYLSNRNPHGGLSGTTPGWNANGPFKTDPNWFSGNDVTPFEDAVETAATGSVNLVNHVARTSDTAILFTNKLQPLGWMDTVTRVWQSEPSPSGDPAGVVDGTSLGTYGINESLTHNSGAVGVSGSAAMQTFLPNIPMLYVMMPPAYKTLFYFRLIIKHKFAFKDFRSCFNVQSYGSASIVPPHVLPVGYGTSTSALANEMSELVADVGTGGPDSVTVENGEIISSADGLL